jgi:hypothetical protein
MDSSERPYANPLRRYMSGFIRISFRERTSPLEWGSDELRRLLTGGRWGFFPSADHKEEHIHLCKMRSLEGYRCDISRQSLKYIVSRGAVLLQVNGGGFDTIGAVDVIRSLRPFREYHVDEQAGRR